MKKILVWLINLYQIMPLNSHACCRFYPTCSEYTKQAIIEHGSIKGLVLGIKRILRCRPLGKHGIDLVPLKEKRWKSFYY